MLYKNFYSLIILFLNSKNSVSVSRLYFKANWAGKVVVKELLLKHENSSLKKELKNATEEIRLKSLKTGASEKGIKINNDILEDDLTIIGIGK